MLVGKTPAECVRLMGINTTEAPFTEEEFEQVLGSYSWMHREYLKSTYELERK